MTKLFRTHVYLSWPLFLTGEKVIVELYGFFGLSHLLGFIARLKKLYEAFFRIFGDGFLRGMLIPGKSLFHPEYVKGPHFSGRGSPFK